LSSLSVSTEENGPLGFVFLFFTFVATLLAGTIAFGVVYNSARISLSERSLWFI
jgi:hypothetical protein